MGFQGFAVLRVWGSGCRAYKLESHIHAYIHTYIHTCIHTYIHTYIHLHICIHIYIYMFIHIYIYIHTYTHIWGFRVSGLRASWTGLGWVQLPFGKSYDQGGLTEFLGFRV